MWKRFRRKSKSTSASSSPEKKVTSASNSKSRQSPATPNKVQHVQQTYTNPWQKMIMPSSVALKIESFMDLRTSIRAERVCRSWKKVFNQSTMADKRPIWMYIIFRKNRKSGHDKLVVKDSFDGPIFWTKQVIYVYCCSCHFASVHEPALMQLCARVASGVRRLCLVDTPVDYCFLPDSFFSYVANHFTSLEFIYLRELDLEAVNFATVQQLAKHDSLKKMVVHKCRNYDVLTDFHQLPQLFIVKDKIHGLSELLSQMAEDGIEMAEGTEFSDNRDRAVTSEHEATTDVSESISEHT